MVKLLVPAGVMAHRVDYGPHGAWETAPNALAFLTVNDFLWRLMGKHRGYPNRYRHREVLQAVAQAGLLPADRVTRSVDEESVRAIQPSMLPRFRRFPVEDLAILDAEFVAARVLIAPQGKPFPAAQYRRGPTCKSPVSDLGAEL
jgi:hypothetical protein